MPDMFTTELLDKHPRMDPADVPDEWIKLAECGYSMTGRGLLANILAVVAPTIQAQAAEAAQQHATETVAEAQHDAQRQADVVAELRRRLAPLERTRDKHTRLRETALRVLRTYQSFLDTDDLDTLRDALTDLQEAANA